MDANEIAELKVGDKIAIENRRLDMFGHHLGYRAYVVLAISKERNKVTLGIRIGEATAVLTQTDFHTIEKYTPEIQAEINKNTLQFNTQELIGHLVNAMENTKRNVFDMDEVQCRAFMESAASLKAFLKIS